MLGRRRLLHAYCSSLVLDANATTLVRAIDAQLASDAADLTGAGQWPRSAVSPREGGAVADADWQAGSSDAGRRIDGGLALWCCLAALERFCVGLRAVVCSSWALLAR